MRPILLGIIFLLLCISVSYASTYQKDNLVDLKYPCFNNNTYCSANSQCNITVLYPNTTVLVYNQLMTNNVSFHNYSIIPKANGEYQVTLMCRDGIDYGFSTFQFKVTPSGDDVSTAKALIYFVGVLVALSLLILFSIVGYKLDGRNKYDEWGKLREANPKKYLKVMMFGIAYMMLMLVMFFAWNIAEKVLYEDFSYIIFQRLFLYLTYIAYPFYLTCLIFFIILFIAEKNTINKLSKGGYFK